MEITPEKPAWISVHFGQRRSDAVVNVNYATQRIVVKHNTAYIQNAVFLEHIPEDGRGNVIGMVLLQTGWTTLYVVRERPNWKASDGTPHYDDYFRLAEQLMAMQGIKPE